MNRMTVIYTDGTVEKYRIRVREEDRDIRLRNFEEVVQDGLLKLIIDEEQIVLIPFNQIRKVIFRPADGSKLKRDYPIFLHGSLDDS